MSKQEIEILYEDDCVIAVNKPSGLVVHSDGRTNEQTLSDWIIERYPNIADVGEPTISNGKKIPRPGIVHRLDRDTSGVLIIAKNGNSFALLKTQFQDRIIKKKYYALVHGALKDNSGTIDRPIGRSAKDFRMRSAARGARGKLRDALTEYTVLARKDGFSFLELRPKTGRTHQIRVHLKAINHPVVCDSLYAGKLGCGLGMTRLALHSAEISFISNEGNNVIITSPLPNDMENAVAKLNTL